jgi:hypothetical protein
MMYFRYAEVGDKVWSLIYGWGEIIKIDNDPLYPITVKFDESDYTVLYRLDGKSNGEYSNQDLFYEEIKFEVPEPKVIDLPVDTKILVWNEGRKTKYKRYFSHFGELRTVYVFANGATSWSAESKDDVTRWDYWKLAEENQ